MLAANIIVTSRRQERTPNGDVQITSDSWQNGENV